MSNPLYFHVTCDRTIDTSSINSSDSPVISHSTLDVGTTQFSSSGSLAQHVQLVTLQNVYRLHIFNKLEVSRLDSRSSSFVIISSYNTVADPGGTASACPPPNRIQFFHFHICFCQKASTSEVGAPPPPLMARHPPPPQREILDPPLQYFITEIPF